MVGIFDFVLFFSLSFLVRSSAGCSKHSIAETALQRHCLLRRAEVPRNVYRMGQTAPFLYDAHREDSRFPTTTFDPKAITRASWEPKPKKKPTPKGPMVSFDLHPEYVC